MAARDHLNAENPTSRATFSLSGSNISRTMLLATERDSSSATFVARLLCSLGGCRAVISLAGRAFIDANDWGPAQWLERLGLSARPQVVWF